MSDSATGPLSGYLFQFEKALVMLAKLNQPDQTVSIEMVDDVAIQDSEDLVTFTVQAKHSLSPNGTTFEDTSTALWRTFQIWVEKIESGIFQEGTNFVCCTNKKIPDNALIRKIKVNDFENVIDEIESLLKAQQQKLKDIKESNPEKGTSIKKINKLIEGILAKRKEFEIIKNGLVIQDEDDPINDFFTAVHMTTDDYTPARKKSALEEMYGWLTSRSKSKWLNSKTATFTKKEFDGRWAQVNANPAIVSAIFRKKSWLGSVDAQRKLQVRTELFVTQIDDIKRNNQAKERKIEQAILDFLYHEIEISHIVRNGNFTQDDFDKFKDRCRIKWQDTYDALVLNELDEYTDEQKNKLAIELFDSIMDKVEVAFCEGIAFTSESRYIHNGTFLNLSNVPEIGWHPDWETKYKNNGI